MWRSFGSTPGRIAGRDRQMDLTVGRCPLLVRQPVSISYWVNRLVKIPISVGRKVNSSPQQKNEKPCNPGL
jgi:hypothetical protein